MKLLVLAQTPPPLHGQSLMVQTLVEGLPSQGIPVHHINLGLSRNAADIGRWRPGKAIAVIAACLRTISARFRHGCDTLYYVPAPGKRGACWRDFVAMLMCRPFFPRLILHWHAAGLGSWLATEATALEADLARLLLGGADVSLVLSDSLRFDAAALRPRRIAIVPNGIAAPPEPVVRAPRPGRLPFQVLFLGLCSEEKGLFTAAEAVLAANRAHAGPGPAFCLVAAGSFPDDPTASRFATLCREHPAALRHVGVVRGTEKSLLLNASHCLCLPTHYPAEGQPLVLLEAMAHDLPIIATRWAAIPDTVPPEALLVEPGRPDALAAALDQLRAHPPSAGVFRCHYLARFTAAHHLATLADVLNRTG